MELFVQLPSNEFKWNPSRGNSRVLWCTKTQAWSAAMRHLAFQGSLTVMRVSSASGFTAIWPRIGQSALQTMRRPGIRWSKGTENKDKRWICVEGKQRTQSVWRGTPEAPMMEQAGVFTPVLLGLTPKAFQATATWLKVTGRLTTSTHMLAHDVVFSPLARLYAKTRGCTFRFRHFIWGGTCGFDGTWQGKRSHRRLENYLLCIDACGCCVKTLQLQKPGSSTSDEYSRQKKESLYSISHVFLCWLYTHKRWNTHDDKTSFTSESTGVPYSVTRRIMTDY